MFLYLVSYNFKTFLRGMDLIQLFAFILAALSLFVIGLKFDEALLPKVSVSIVWCLLLLASLTPYYSIFVEDREKGVIDSLQFTESFNEAYVLSKILVHWLLYLLPLVFCLPFFAFLLQLEAEKVWWLFISLSLVTPSLSALSVMGAALTIEARHAFLITVLITLPLYLPMMILSFNIIEPFDFMPNRWVFVLLLIAIWLISWPVSSIIGAFAIKQIIRE